MTQKPKDEIQKAIHLNNTLVLPAAAGLYFAEPLVALTFEHGQFTPMDTASTAHLYEAMPLRRLEYVCTGFFSLSSLPLKTHIHQ